MDIYYNVERETAQLISVYTAHNAILGCHCAWVGQYQQPCLISRQSQSYVANVSSTAVGVSQLLEVYDIMSTQHRKFLRKGHLLRKKIPNPVCQVKPVRQVRGTTLPSQSSLE